VGRLEGRAALVTGGGRGIGRAIALALAGQGADVAVTARTESEIEAVAGEIAALGRRAVAIPADAMSADETRGAVREAAARLGRLDALVNNVGGIVAPRGLEDLMPFTRSTREALGPMREQGYGRIVNIGSGYAKNSGGLLAYTAAKHGIVGFTRALAAQVAPFGITVNCLCPGWTNTRLVDFDVLAVAYGSDAAGARAKAEADNLQKRILEPEELGPMAGLLCAEESAGITGQVISVDGGFMV